MPGLVLKKKAATGSFGYVVMFTMDLLMIVLTLYMAQVARLMTNQHHVDDSLADLVLASLVADDIYYFEMLEMTGTPVVRFQSVDRSHSIFMDSMNEALSETTGFYYNFSFDSYICYEVEGNQVKITSYTGSSGAKSVSYGRLGSVYSPKGEKVKETSAYGRVRFDIKNIIDSGFITKTKDIVDVYAVGPATEMLVLMAENVYISDVYDNAGNKIKDEEGVATSFTV